ncbi:MAG: PASTA domain-containing protein [Actinomycetia bacterium]|nr:PASTA domain-containing protein [Actinomycetes bacterium]
MAERPRVTEIGGWETIDRRRHPLAAAIAMGVIIAVFAVALVGLGVAIERGDKRVEVVDIVVPSIVGLSEDEARSLLETAGLIMVVDESPNEVVGTGAVFEQEPIAGAKLEEGSPVTAVVSTGPAGTIVPETVGQQASDAEALLATIGLTSQPVPVFDEDVRPGEVLGSDPAAGRRAPADRVVLLRVSNGPAPRTVPEIADRRAVDVLAELGRLNLIPDDITTETGTDLPGGAVLSIDPVSGTEVPRGSRVNLVVAGSQEDRPTVMPSLAGLLESTASQAASAAGVRVSFRTVDLPVGDSRDGRVIRQGVVAGAELPDTVVVEVVVGLAPPPPTTTAPPEVDDSDETDDP